MLVDPIEVAQASLAMVEVHVAIAEEMVYQDDKHPGQNQKSLGEWIILMEDELAEAKKALIKGGKGRDSVNQEILQVITVGVRALMQHGTKPIEERAI